jgi:energy-coupling factor transporter ATP-binding protein EcfA2
MSIQQDILEFSSRLPLWEQDLIRRLVSQPSLSDEDFEEVRSMLYAAHKVEPNGEVASWTPKPLSNDDVTASDELQMKTLLISLKDVANTNRLVKGQTLLFALDGITIAYGDNGSGKSGYSRLLKALCRARRERPEPILGDVFEPTEQPPAQVTVAFQSDSNVRTVPWQDGTPPPRELSRISIFDAATVPLYADRLNQIEFLPRGLDVMPRLGASLARLANGLDRDLSPLRQLTGAPLFFVPAGTHAAVLIERLTLQSSRSLPRPEEIREESQWDEGHERRFSELTEQLRSLEEPAKQAARHKRLSVAIRGAASQVETIETTLRPLTVAALEQQIATLASARQAASFAATELFAADPFGGHVGSNPWRTLYEDAKQFSTIVYPGEDFPVTGPDRFCVLCQQPLSPAAVERFKRFKAFIEGMAQQDVATGERELKTSETALAGLRLPSEDGLHLQLDEFAELGVRQTQLVLELSEYWKALSEHVHGLERLIMGEVKSESVPPCPASIQPTLLKSCNDLDETAKQYEAVVQDKAKTVEVQKENDELVGRKTLCANLAALLERHAQVDRARRLTRCREACDTTSVSLKNTALRKTYITEDFTRRITEEVAALGLSYLPLKTEGRTERGTGFIGVALDKVGSEKTSNILSEGEFRCLAVACFFAEISAIPGGDGIILDDPVCSLDHRHSRQVARRLVVEAKKRQVIVFTHDLSFYYELWEAALEERVPVARHWVSATSPSGFGLISLDTAPWQAKKVRERLQELEEMFTRLPEQNTCASEIYLGAAEDFYGHLRETWERLVEERLFNGVVGRFQPSVKTQSLGGVTVEDSDFEKVYLAMAKCSNYSGHDRAVGKRLSVPSKEEMRKDLVEAREYERILGKRADDLRRKRQPAVEAPMKATTIAT